MRAKLVHGTNSMTWANKVLPTYMRAPWGSQSGESTRFLANEVQVAAGFPSDFANASLDPDVVGDDRIRRQFAAVPHGVEAHGDRPGHLHLDPNALRCDCALAHREHAKRQSPAKRELALRACAL